MQINELRKKSKRELQQELESLERERFNLNVQKATGQLTKPHLIKAARRNIARVKTLLKMLKDH